MIEPLRSHDCHLVDLIKHHHQSVCLVTYCFCWISSLGNTKGEGVLEEEGVRTCLSMMWSLRIAVACVEYKKKGREGRFSRGYLYFYSLMGCGFLEGGKEGKGEA